MNEYILTAIIGIATSCVGWFAAKRKNLAESRATELENVEKAVKMYREMVEDLGAKYKTAISDVDALSAKYKDAISQLHEAKDQLKRADAQLQLMMEENRHLIEELQKFKQLNGKQNG
ncbi:hypothetical protein [Flavobacterium cerinum]|uniref:Cell wall anchor protein n=1 Tax=Flavobacterium cerinum TaxID=2502784 RepID=A0A3S3Q9G0_9FLAO|nr:hypothetical protein [Flavobacterium cerinum]RWX00921.1 hypothetical protein EPI11_07825 [Flavobacterium cerinum]